MRQVLAILLVVTLAGCGGFPEPPNERLGRVLQDGSLVIGQGQVNGQQWVSTIARRGASLCSSWTIMGDPQPVGQGCTSVGEGAVEMIRAVSVGSATGLPTIVDGIVDDQVIAVQLQSSIGAETASTVSLAAVGYPGRAFALVVPERSELTVLIALDAAGNELERSDLSHMSPWPTMSP